MKFNIAYPTAGLQKSIEVDDDNLCRPFFDRRIGHQVEADTLGQQWKGYTFKINGGNDKDGFPMMQGVLIKGRVRLLLSKKHKCYGPDRKGQRKRKSIRGCIVGPDIRVLGVSIVKKGEKDIQGLTTEIKPRRLGPKRANKIKKLFGLTKKDAHLLVRKNVVRRTYDKNGKKYVKAPKIQRLITESRLRRKAIHKKQVKARWNNTIAKTKAFHQLLKTWKEKKNQEKEADQKKTKQKQENKKKIQKQKNQSKMQQKEQKPTGIPKKPKKVPKQEVVKKQIQKKGDTTKQVTVTMQHGVKTTTTKTTKTVKKQKDE